MRLVVLTDGTVFHPPQPSTHRNMYDICHAKFVLDLWSFHVESDESRSVDMLAMIAVYKSVENTVITLTKITCGGGTGPLPPPVYHSLLAETQMPCRCYICRFIPHKG